MEAGVAPRAATTNCRPDCGHTNSPRSTNFEFHCRYLSHIRGRYGVMASLSIGPSALEGLTGSQRMPRVLTAARKLGGLVAQVRHHCRRAPDSAVASACAEKLGSLT
jgi:hypothetical protein